MIVPLEPGAAADASARLLAVPLEKELGIPVQVVNKPGAGMQTGTTEFVRSKNDGYTICMTNLPTILGLYLDPERKAIFSRKDFLTSALMGVDPAAIGVKADSPFKSLKDIIDAAKANPGKVTIGLTGLKSHQHLAFLELQKLAGVQFNMVVFDGSAPTMTALLGGHIDVQLSSVGLFMPQLKSGGVRVLAVADAKESPFLPGVKTLEAQGYKLYNSNSRGWSLLAGTPKEAVDTLSVAMKKAMADPTFQAKMAEQGLEVRYMAPEEYAAYWDNMEKQVKPLLDEIAASTK